MREPPPGRSFLTSWPQAGSASSEVSPQWGGPRTTSALGGPAGEPLWKRPGSRRRTQVRSVALELARPSGSSPTLSPLRSQLRLFAAVPAVVRDATAVSSARAATHQEVLKDCPFLARLTTLAAAPEAKTRCVLSGS